MLPRYDTNAQQPVKSHTFKGILSLKYHLEENEAKLWSCLKLLMYMLVTHICLFL